MEVNQRHNVQLVVEVVDHNAGVVVPIHHSDEVEEACHDVHQPSVDTDDEHVNEDIDADDGQYHGETCDEHDMQRQLQRRLHKMVAVAHDVPEDLVRYVYPNLLDCKDLRQH